VAGADEVVVEGETGRLVAPGDLDGLTGCVARLVDDEQERRRLGARAAKRCRSRFSIDTVAARYLSVFDELIRERAGSLT
jgi:glycosyltransferase involved in cell wall biosynthesis